MSTQETNTTIPTDKDFFTTMEEVLKTVGQTMADNIKANTFTVDTVMQLNEVVTGVATLAKASTTIDEAKGKAQYIKGFYSDAEKRGRTMASLELMELFSKLRH